MKIVAGLGNPGKQYEYSRHNMGFLCADFLQKMWDFSPWRENSSHALESSGTLDGEKILIIKPLTFMNLSGDAIVPILSYYRLDPKRDLIVITDDLDMEFAKIRFRAKGNHGGQNGLRDIITKIGNNEFARLKIGIGRDPHYSAADWVLSRFSPGELMYLQDAVFASVATTIRDWCTS